MEKFVKSLASFTTALLQSMRMYCEISCGDGDEFHASVFLSFWQERDLLTGATGTGKHSESPFKIGCVIQKRVLYVERTRSTSGVGYGIMGVCRMTSAYGTV